MFLINPPFSGKWTGQLFYFSFLIRKQVQRVKLICPRLHNKSVAEEKLKLQLFDVKIPLFSFKFSKFDL